MSESSDHKDSDPLGGGDLEWPGCHGVRIHGADLALGWCRGRPLLDVTVVVEPLAAPQGEVVWSLPGSDPAVSHRLHREGTGDYLLQVGTGRRLAVSADGERITVTPPVDAVQTQLVASFGLPLLLGGPRTLLLHAAAVARGGVAVLLAGPGGSGKSTSLSALVEAGWEALSEDVCVVDLASTIPTVWPGPPWVRLRTGERGPTGGEALFSTGDKTAWDLSPWRSAQPARVGAIVAVDPPGGAVPRWEPLERSAALAELATHGIWLGPPAERGRRLFPAVASAATRLAVARLRVPRDLAWRDQLVGVLDEELPSV